MAPPPGSRVRIRPPGSSDPDEYSYRCYGAPAVPPLPPPGAPVLPDGCPSFAELAQMSEAAVGRLAAAMEADRAGALAERDQWLAKVTGAAGVVEGCARASLSFLVSDPTLPGHPITYASPAFLELTGFSAEEARRLNETQQLNGPETDVQALLACARAMQEQTPLNVRLRLYTKARVPFWSQWWITPLFDRGVLRNWLGVFLHDDDAEKGSSGAPQLWLPRELPSHAAESEVVGRALGALQERFGGGPDGAEVLAPMTATFVARCFGTPGAKKRTFEANLAKLAACCEWRRHRRPWAIRDSEVEEQLRSGALHWAGFAKDGSPVLYARPGKIERVDPAALELAHVWALERGLRLMQPGVTGFVVVVDTGGMGVHHLSTELCRLLQPLVDVAFFGRMDACVAGPSSAIASAAWRLLRALLPRTVAEKITYCRSPRAALLASGLLREADIPTFVS